jgi:hypothetical protein
MLTFYRLQRSYSRSQLAPIAAFRGKVADNRLFGSQRISIMTVYKYIQINLPGQIFMHSSLTSITEKLYARIVYVGLRIAAPIAFDCILLPICLYI